MRRPVALPLPFLSSPVFRCDDHHEYQEPTGRLERGMTSDLSRAEELVARHRNLGCREYDACLDRAVERGWKNFSCRECPLAEGAAATKEGSDHE